MENIDERLRETSNRCIKAYEDWKTKETDPKKREELREAIHELRKVSSRLEIEMAVSEREEMAQKPIPIPPHRASKGGRKEGQKGKKSGGPQNKKGRGNQGNDSDNSGSRSVDASVEKLKKSRGSNKDNNKKSSGSGES